MPRLRPPTSGYARIAQVEQEEEEYQDDPEAGDTHHNSTRVSQNGALYAPIQPGRQYDMHASGPTSPLPDRKPSHGRRRHRTNSGIDIKAINARLEKWAEEITSKLKVRRIKGKTQEEEKLEIHHSVFQASEGGRPATAETLASQYSDQPEEKMTKAQFDEVVESVRVAIEIGVHPKMISQGSSGSYFARNSEGKIVAVFKPKDEEPYASKNPKWTKWLHRNLFPFAFGRACLIPNLSYVSEAAAYVLDTRLQTNLVPPTDIVYLSSVSFNYDFWDRRAYYRKRKHLPQKVGSFQVFLKGYQDANVFLKQHPWPDQPSGTLHRSSVTKKRRRRWAEDCRPGGLPSDTEEESSTAPGNTEARRRKRFWTDALQQSFREELEKLVILDYIMRNTDRGLDNWMIKIDQGTQKASIFADIPKADNTRKMDIPGNPSDPYTREDPMTTNGPNAPSQHEQLATIGAIDNSLSWPWKHPDAWRSFPFGWLFLPVSLIGQPFTSKTREHFMPLLTSKQWWSETQVALRDCFSQDADFQERMFARQIAVMKGQAWNVLETLKTPDHGPLELTRRARVCVWDDLVEIPIVVPLRVPSSEMRRHQQADASLDISDDGMDISAVRWPAAQAEIQTAQHHSEFPNPNRFDLSPQPTRDMEDNSQDFPSIGKAVTWDLGAYSQHGEPPNGASLHRDTTQPRKRSSYDEPRLGKQSTAARRRNLSLSARRLSDHYDDDANGDLGYAAANEMEGHRKKVIVERLEMVKSKGPVFTWC